MQRRHLVNLLRPLLFLLFFGAASSSFAAESENPEKSCCLQLAQECASEKGAKATAFAGGVPGFTFGLLAIVVGTAGNDPAAALSFAAISWAGWGAASTAAVKRPLAKLGAFLSGPLVGLYYVTKEGGKLAYKHTKLCCKEMSAAKAPQESMVSAAP